MKNKKLKNNMIIYQAKDGSIEFTNSFKDETIWATQSQIAKVFGVDVRTINEHFQNIYNSRELLKSSTIRKFRIVQKEGNRDISRLVMHYNLDAIISEGRVNINPSALTALTLLIAESHPSKKDQMTSLVTTLFNMKK